MRRTPRRAGILLAALPLCTLLLVHAAPRAEAAGPPHCAAGAFPVDPAPPAHLARPGQDAQGVLVALRPDVAPRSGGTQVVLNGSGLTPYTRVLFGSLTPDGCFTGLEATGVTVISDSSVIATAPQWPVAGTVSVVAATPCGRITNQLPFTYVDQADRDGPDRQDSRRSTMRLILPTERSRVSGSTTSTFTETPTPSLTARTTEAAAASR